MFQTCTVNYVSLFSESFSLETRWVIIDLELGYKAVCVCVCAKLLQSCPTLGNPMDCSQSDFCVHGNLQARITGVGCHAHTLWLRDPRKLTNSYTVQIRIVMIYLMSIDQTGYFRARQFATLEMNDDGFVQATTVKVSKR